MNIAEKIILEAVKKKPHTPDELNELKRKILRTSRKKTIPNTSLLLKSYHKLVKMNKIEVNETLEKLFVKRAVRTLSGVSIVTVLTEPFPCPGQCTYCPNETTMPKSYISDEPAAARALLLKFDPYQQVKRRLEALHKNGHPTDKVELIVKGGTWNAYPINYQYWFILRCFEASNSQRSRLTTKSTLEKIKKTLRQAQIKNEKAQHRIIGLTLETRPDHITEKNILIMRELGCTRIEMGVQTIDKKILKLIKRGHDVQAVITATELLKKYGYKVDYHLMPQLPGTTPKKDLAMMKEIFINPNYRPDMIKIYPCTVIKNSELYNWLHAGKYQPYSDKKLIEVLKTFKTTLPRYVRLSRLIRDIPAHHIEAGNKMTNLRQVVQNEMAKDDTHCQCLRCREIGHQKIDETKPKDWTPKIFIDKYEASGGTEYFLSFEDKKRRVVYAFCRLRLDKNGAYPAFIRELHTYGQMLSIGAKKEKASQHKGMGIQLVEQAEKICRQKHTGKLAVISGVGVRGYYRKLGFKLEKTYMVKTDL